MSEKSPLVDAYLETAAPFARPILTRVRNAFHRGCPRLVEAIKWRAPCFELDGRILGGMVAFQAHVSWGLWDAAELADPEDLFRNGKASIMNAQAVAELSELPKAAVLVDYVRRAAALRAESGGKPRASRRRAPVRVQLPAELEAGLKRRAKAKRFFDSLPPGQQREYCEWIKDAQREATRERRLATALEWLAEGKRRNWKYERC